MQVGHLAGAAVAQLVERQTEHMELEPEIVKAQCCLTMVGGGGFYVLFFPPSFFLCSHAAFFFYFFCFLVPRGPQDLPPGPPPWA